MMCVCVGARCLFIWVIIIFTSSYLASAFHIGVTEVEVLSIFNFFPLWTIDTYLFFQIKFRIILPSFSREIPIGILIRIAFY